MNKLKIWLSSYLYEQNFIVDKVIQNIQQKMSNQKISRKKS